MLKSENVKKPEFGCFQIDTFYHFGWSLVLKTWYEIHAPANY